MAVRAWRRGLRERAARLELELVLNVVELEQGLLERATRFSAVRVRARVSVTCWRWPRGSPLLGLELELLAGDGREVLRCSLPQ